MDHLQIVTVAEERSLDQKATDAGDPCLLVVWKCKELELFWDLLCAKNSESNKYQNCNCFVLHGAT